MANEHEQNMVNEFWADDQVSSLMAVLKHIHLALCPDESGTWEQLPEQALEAAWQVATDNARLRARLKELEDLNAELLKRLKAGVMTYKEV